MRIATIGGIPRALGGGGLERQIRETAAALAARGHEVVPVADAEPDGFDVLHAFGAEPDVCHVLSHWRLTRVPLVVSPVIVVRPERARLERVTARVPLSTWGPRMRAQLLRSADLVVAQSRHEHDIVTALGANRVATVPNGVTREVVGPPPADTPSTPYVLLVGSVSRRKRQQETVAALAGLQPVVAGGFEGTAGERREFERTVADAGGRWLGEVHDRPALLGLVRGADALVHLSRAEGQSLAVLEALTLGTPVVASHLPATVELAATYPGHVHLARDPEEARAVVRSLPPRPARAAPVPTWDDVAARLEPLYESLLP